VNGAVQLRIGLDHLERVLDRMVVVGACRQALDPARLHVQIHLVRIHSAGRRVGVLGFRADCRPSEALQHSGQRRQGNGLERELSCRAPCRVPGCQHVLAGATEHDARLLIQVATERRICILERVALDGIEEDPERRDDPIGFGLRLGDLHPPFIGTRRLLLIPACERAHRLATEQLIDARPTPQLLFQTIAESHQIDRVGAVAQETLFGINDIQREDARRD
jgi:hypothetical protein